MLFYIILILVLLVVLYLLLVPIVLYIDTETHTYYLKIKGLATANIYYDDEEFLKINLKVFWINFLILPLKHKRRSKSKKKFKETSKKPLGASFPLRKLWRIIKSFDVKQFQLDMDTGDCITNSKLYPIFACCNFYLGSQMHVNYQGKSRLLLSIQNRPIRLMRSYMNI